MQKKNTVKPKLDQTSSEAWNQLNTTQQVEHYFSEQHPETDEVAACLAELLAHLLHDSPQRDALARTVYLACKKAWKASRSETSYVTMHDLRDLSTVAYHAALINAIQKIYDPAGYKIEIAREKNRVKEGYRVERRLRLGRVSKKTKEISLPEPEPQDNLRIEELRARLQNLETLPENEAVRFQLETEIYRLEQEQKRDEWPEVIGGEDER
jgi:hypothetical protein